MAERMGRIAERYSNWALGKKTKVQQAGGRLINNEPQPFHAPPRPSLLPPSQIQMHRPPLQQPAYHFPPQPAQTNQPRPTLYQPTQQIYHFPKKLPEFPRLVQLPETSLLFPANASVFPDHMLLPNPNLSPPSLPSKEEVMRIASKKQKFGMMRPHIFNECVSGWCGDGCCPMRQEMQTTIQAQALPGSPTPPHPLVLILHPPPQIQQPQCSPACQPQCNPQCVTRLQYIEHSQFYNTIQAPMCRQDCMPSCHVDCLIIPPERVRCQSFHCQCGSGYIPCAAFTCCMRYPSMVARMKNNALQKSEEVIFPKPVEKEEEEDGSEEEDEDIFLRPQRVPKFTKFKRDPVKTTIQPPSSTSTTSTTSTTTSTTSTTTTTPEPTTTKTPIINLAPIYPDNRKVPFIPAFEVGDLRGRHIIRSENFLDVLSELAQVKLKEDIGEPLSFIDLVTDDDI
ncbi:unnamed protein product [Caenorhabditis angaria]|uniref:Uncharacterized protein n=1 Tax=Caenorhabditis angaria TaxID=860376 RepID=A0A9P1IVC5_9PELO|nr:unnamed protein product [Caenorhabditis angaria]